ncbi:HlyIII-domain-containing protein [Polychaeton citri CBS 116435]|uniref:HlyIII-domain-containing protein n=1 Tax=Polychaeton citri CBS 116435 TaxID=1314669 RepID=A0A9P4Q3K2_9PEZI|nr:HlyIII-domain-containing protein [Polychaeton citri CBS 116435]
MSSKPERSTADAGPKAKANKALTVLWDELQAWQQDNHYITSGYRPASNSYRQSAASIGYLHNETVNIWTHLLGAVGAVATSFWLYRAVKPRYDLATTEDVFAFSCFFIGAVVCLGMSATFHTISNHSQHVAKFGNQLDYMGIVALIWGSFIPSVYYGFKAYPHLVHTYWTMISTAAVVVFTVIFYPKFRSPQWRPLRAGAFVAMGLMAIFPSIHGLLLYGLAQLELRIGFSWLVTQGVLYITGAAIYAARIPERWKPGQFDLFGSSHQIFHVLVVLAAATHLVGLLKAFDYEHGFRSSLSSG